MKKQILSIILAVCMVIALVPQAAFAAEAGRTYTALAGTGEKDSNEGYVKLLDGRTDTKWCVTSFSDAYIIFKTSTAVKASGYTITTADDNEKFPGRNPKNWILYGCNDYNASSDSGSWKLIHNVSNDTVLQDKNKTEYHFVFEKTNTAYQYYKLQITEIQSGSVMQMSEFALTDCDHIWESTLIPATCTAQGYKATTCTTCQVAKNSETIMPLGHDFSGEGGRCTRCSRTEEELYPGVSSYAEKAQLMDSTFAPDSNGTAANMGKLVFGKKTDGTASQEWYILGKDTGVSGENTVIFAANSIKNESGNELAFETDYDINKTDTLLWNDCKYNGTNPTEVYPNHYGASELRDTLQEMATSNFTAAEQSMMNATTVTTRDAMNDADYTTTDKLYALTADSYDPSSELRNTIVKAGSNDQISLAMNPYWNENISGGGFWLRAPFNDNSDPYNREKALCASLHNYVYYNPVYVGYDVRPVGNLNLSSVLFASAATASYDTAAAGTIPSDKAMTLRLDGSDKKLGIVINYAKTGEIKATKGDTTGTVSLVVQGREGTKDWYYSKPITGTETVKASDIQSELSSSANIDLSACRIWLETTGEDGMIYAVNAYKGTEKINTTYATKEQLMNSFTPYSDGTVVNTGKLVFGKNNEGTSQEWYILGKDDGVAGENTIIFAASPVKNQYYAFSILSSDTQTYDYKAGTGYGSPGGQITVASNHYGASGLRRDLQSLLTTKFTEAERRLINETTVKTADILNKDSSGNNIIYTTTDKLYALHGNYGETRLYAGSRNQTVLAMDRFWGSGDFWLRTPTDRNYFELCAVPGDSVRDKSIKANAYVKPASNLNLSSVLFASAATASYDAESSGTIPSDKAMTLRLDGSSENIGFATYTTEGEINAAKGSTTGTVALVVQGNDGTNDWYYSKPINGTETVDVTDITAEIYTPATVDLSACKIWLETTGENGMIYAVDAAKAISAVEITDIDAPTANTALDTQAVCVTTDVSSITPSVSWTPVHTNAGYNTSYTASVTLTAETGCVFMDSATATVNGNAATSVTKNTDGTLTVTYKFGATVKDKLISITAPQAITAANGTHYENMNLPTQVNIVTKGNTVTSASIEWDTTTPADGSYNPSILTEQTVTLNGTVTCPDNIDDNGVSLNTTITITISAAGIVGAPTASPATGTYTENQSVTLTSSTEGAVIYYTTDGSEPTLANGAPSGTTVEYTAPIAVTGAPGQSITTTIQAIAVKEGMNNSNVVTFIYTITTKDKLISITAPEAITVANGTTYKNMNLPTQVNITTEGNTETSSPVTWNTETPANGSYNPNVLTEQKVTLRGNVTCPANVYANEVSLTTTITITISAAGIVGAPTATPAAGTYTENQSVTLTSSTEGAEIYYTIDGTSPSQSNGTKYTEAISVTGTEGKSIQTIIKAIAVKDKMQSSDVVTFTYTIKIPAQQNNGGGGGYIPLAQKPIVENDDNGTTSADLSNTTSTSGGTTAANIDKSTGEEIVDKAVSNKSEEIVIDATAKHTTAADSTVVAQVGIPTAALKGIAEKTEADVTVKTDVAEVKMDNAAAGAVAEQAAGDTVQIIVEKVDETADKVEFQLKVVCSDGNVIRDFNGGNVAVTVEIPNNMASKEIVCVYIDDDGRMSKVNSQKNADGTYTFFTSHFSTYALMTEEEAAAAIAAQKEEIIAKMESYELIARSMACKSPSGKKAIRIRVYDKNGLSTDFFDGIEIYRSTKSNSRYGKKPIFVTKSGKSSYYNTAIKSGTRYYYRVRGFVIIDGKKHYTDYSLKAIRTAK